MKTDGSLGSALRSTALLSAALLAACAAPAAARAQVGPDEETARAHHLLSRATWGVRPAELEAVLAGGREAWLERQLHPERIDESALQLRLSAYGTLSLTMAELAGTFQPPARVLRELLMAMGDTAGAAPGDLPPRQALSPELRLALQERNPQRITNELVAARLVRAVHAERQLEEVMTDFWFDHFNVFAGQAQIRFTVADYEREAIRPHVFGRFEDMLRATATHPAMLLYLDNWTSVAPDSLRDMPQARLRQLERFRQLSPAEQERMRRAGRLPPGLLQDLRSLEEVGPVPPALQRGRGMNENYARELMELHTMGVDGGYTQEDVVEVARAFTGWTFVPLRFPAAGASATGALGDLEAGAFLFNWVGHDRGEKTVLGERLPGGRGVEDGEDVLRLLAGHPSTARFLAGKLVERFVSDTPDAAFVEELAEVYLRTDGDLRELTRALFTSPRFHAPEVRGAKVKTPFELVASALRVVHAEARPSRRIQEALRVMGHLPYAAAAPTGYPAASEDWVSSGALLARMSFASDLAAGRIDEVRADPSRILPGGVAGDAESVVADLLAAVLPATDTHVLAGLIVAELDGAPPPGRGAAGRHARALGLALGSPEFQRR